MLRFTYVLLASLPTLQACTTVVVPPSEPIEPQRVFLLDHGRHASLVLPGRDDRAIRYSYGDWRYYAQVKTGGVIGAAALLWPTRAGLGRRELAGPPSEAGVRQNTKVRVQHLYELLVETERIEWLRAHLDSIFSTALASRIYNSAYDLEFVYHPEPYWALHNSNQMVAVWLRELGCRVNGPALFSRWTIEPIHVRAPPP